MAFGCPVAIGFAASYPDRVGALVLAGGFAQLTRLGEFILGGTRAGSMSEPAARG